MPDPFSTTALATRTDKDRRLIMELLFSDSTIPHLTSLQLSSLHTDDIINWQKSFHLEEFTIDCCSVDVLSKLDRFVLNIDCLSITFPYQTDKLNRDDLIRLRTLQSEISMGSLMAFDVWKLDVRGRPFEFVELLIKTVQARDKLYITLSTASIDSLIAENWKNLLSFHRNAYHSHFQLHLNITVPFHEPINISELSTEFETHFWTSKKWKVILNVDIKKQLIKLKTLPYNKNNF
ncbi:unnamed protein product [Didymodactylos carnosus]|uniref:Uncharacterized protein n=1 Tax=Didymodactylos carnosus TaxID=1234261 RepID=A0A8S2ENY8_9BILA|nr:unnamed protein product [Didymodactylos carnosus]CAF4007765.1 unnamed protein product [Didymodactylos carnosus]